MKKFALSLLVSTAAIAFVSTTFAADLIIEEPVEVGIVDVSGDWDGAYIGVFAGYGWGTVHDIDENGYFDGSDYTQDISGWLLGVNVGANFTVGGGIVAGIVGDIAWSNITGVSSWPVETTVNWMGSLRGNLGFDGGAFMPYLTAGLAVANMTVDDQFYSYTDTQTHLGWTAGAGVKFAVTDNMSVDLLYRYSDYGSMDYALYYGDSPIDFTTHTVQVGLNWSF